MGVNIYSTSSEDIDDEAPVIADLFATQGALALGRLRQLNNLNVALTSREVIGKAIGILMVAYEVDQQTGMPVSDDAIEPPAHPQETRTWRS